MQKLLAILGIAGIIAFSACTKKKENNSCNEITGNFVKAADSAALANYIAVNDTDAIYEPRGFYYKINQEGTGEKPNQCDIVRMDYTTKLTNGTRIDGNMNARLGLEYMINGFRMGTTLIGTGGDITFYLPATLAYGSEDQNGIPGGSILIFNVKLHSIEKK